MWIAPSHFFSAHHSGSAFMACRWHELFSSYTPDTFHPRLFSIASLVSEAVAIAHLHEDHDAWSKHLRLVQGEIGERLQRGFERTLCGPRMLGMLDQLASQTTKPSEIAGVGRVLELEDLSGLLEKSACERLSTLDLTKVASKKSEADSLLSVLATYAFHKGCTEADCSQIEEVIPRGGDAVRDWILQALPSGSREFDCIVAVEAPDAKTHTAIRKICDHSRVRQASPKTPGLPDLKDVIYLRSPASGIRPGEALEALKTEIRANLNLLALYGQQRAPEILSDGWVVLSKGVTPVKDPGAAFRNLHPRRNAVELADQAAGALANGRDEPAIRAALDLHNLALSMKDHGLRLVNLWSALECLASVVDGDTIISRVARLVTPILTWRKVDKTVRYLAISIHFWLQKNPQIDRRSLPFPLGHTDSVAPEHILTLLTQPKNSLPIRALLNVVSGHPLMVYRINAAWEALHDPAALHRDLRTSSQRLDWHLWRIYRARNLLVHKGVVPACLPQLANHLQQYLSWMLTRFLHGLTNGPKWTAKDSWHFWKAKSDFVTTALATRPHILTVGDMFPESLREPGYPIWPSEPESKVSAVPEDPVEGLSNPPLATNTTPSRSEGIPGLGDPSAGDTDTLISPDSGQQ